MQIRPTLNFMPKIIKGYCKQASLRITGLDDDIVTTKSKGKEVTSSCKESTHSIEMKECVAPESYNTGNSLSEISHSP
jgi:hypothetical protein